MDKDRISGAAKQVEGAVKEGAAKVFGNDKLQAEGMVEKTVGQAQSKLGEVKDNIRDAAKPDAKVETTTETRTTTSKNAA